MSAYKAVQDRQTDDVIVVTFRNWTERILYDSRRTPYDIPIGFDDYPVESINTDGELTIIEI